VFPRAIYLPQFGQMRLKEHSIPANNGPVVGVDLGVKTLGALSDGTSEPNPRHLRTCLKQLKRLQRAVTRKQRGSCNRRKAAQRLATLHRRIAHQRANTIHQLTRRLANTKSAAVIEDLNVSGMLKKPSAGAVHWGRGLWRVPAAAEVHGG